MAKRLEKVLPKIINPDQTGYVKGRYIGENIRLIQDLMFYTEKENLPGIAVFIDFRKAFDTIEWHYLEKVLTHFNLGPNFLQWFKILHTDISSCVLNNGHASHFFFSRTWGETRLSIIRSVICYWSWTPYKGYQKR